MPSNWTRLFALVPAANVAAEPSPKFVLAVDAVTSDRLLEASKTPERRELLNVPEVMFEAFVVSVVAEVAKPVTPEEGKPVQLVKVPLDGVPNAPPGAT